MSKSEINDFILRHYKKFTDAEIAKLITADGIRIGAQAIQLRRKKLGLRKNGVTRGVKALSHPSKEHLKMATPKKDNLGKVAELLEKSGIPLEEIDSVQSVRINAYQGLTKDADGEVQIHDLEAASLVLKPKWADGPAWPVVQPADPVIVKVKATPKRKSWGKTAIILPDPQFGFRRYDDGTLDPFHDEKAISVALQLVKELQPDIIINIGDILDLAEFSRFVGEASFARTTQVSLNAAHKFLATQRALCPKAEIVLFEGNHDLRIQTWIKQNGMAAFGLRRADEPEGWPVMSVPTLLALDALNIQYISGYPAASYFINDRVKVIHGNKTGKRGTVANKLVADEQVSTISGHTHGLEMFYHTVDTQRGPRTRFGATVGCLCRIDGAVPSTKGGHDAFGRPIKKYEDWQQAVGVVTYMDGDNPFALEHAYIHEGFSLFRGTPYFAEQL